MSQALGPQECTTMTGHILSQTLLFQCVSVGQSALGLSFPFRLKPCWKLFFSSLSVLLSASLVPVVSLLKATWFLFTVDSLSPDCMRLRDSDALLQTHGGVGK